MLASKLAMKSRIQVHGNAIVRHTRTRHRVNLTAQILSLHLAPRLAGEILLDCQIRICCEKCRAHGFIYAPRRPHAQDSANAGKDRARLRANLETGT